jgi:hypothetical protein
MNHHGDSKFLSQCQMIPKKGFLEVAGRVVVEEVQTGFPYGNHSRVVLDQCPDSVQVPWTGALRLVGMNPGGSPEPGPTCIVVPPGIVATEALELCSPVHKVGDALGVGPVRSHRENPPYPHPPGTEQRVTAIVIELRIGEVAVAVDEHPVTR